MKTYLHGVIQRRRHPLQDEEGHPTEDKPDGDFGRTYEPEQSRVFD